MPTKPSLARRRTRICRLEALESRLLLSADLRWDPFLAVDPGIPAIATVTNAPAAQVAAAYPLSSVPALHSNPAAAAKLYLDFDGAAAQTWGSYSVTATPAFDQDGAPTSFSDAELSAMQTIWARVSESYAPFPVDVTTVNPGTLADKQALQVVFGGDGAWSGGTYGGIAYVGSFYNSAPNTVWIFTKNLGNGNAKYSADAGAHEAGHGFGLTHQSSYDANGVKTAEYNQGDALRAPIMGVSYYAARGLWWYGTSSNGPTSYQDDLALLTDGRNGFGFRADDHADTLPAADPLTVTSNSVSQSGIITTKADKDVFSFTTAAGTISLSGNVVAAGPMLDLRLDLYTDTGTLLVSADTTSLGETLTATVAAGSYRLVVASHGNYGDVGQYTVSGMIVAPTDLFAAPSNLTATAVATSQVNLSWQDNTADEDGFRIERTSDGGTTWAALGSTAANVTSATDTTAAAGTAYLYRVSAYRGTTVSSFSNTASTVTVPAGPASASASAISASQIDVTWSNVSGESSYKIERSLTGTSGWTQVATTAADVMTYRDSSLQAGTTYYYRVSAANAAGTSVASPVASATTQTSSLPAAPTNLTLTNATRTSLTLRWTDNANNESGFKIERSTNGQKWNQVAIVGANVTTYVDSGLKRNTTYYYRVRAYAAAGNSGYSNAVSTRTLATLPVGAAPLIEPALAGTTERGADAGSAAVSPATLSRCDPRAVDRLDLADLGKGVGDGSALEDVLAGDLA